MNVNGKLFWTLFTTILSLYLQECEFRYVSGFKYPVYTTNACPRNSSELEERAATLNCTEENSYACFPNENITELVEFCYTQSRISIPPGQCVFLSTKTISDLDSYNCINFESGCPRLPYSASTIYAHPSCVLIGNGCFLAEPFCERRQFTSTTLESTTQQGKDMNVQNNNHILWISLCPLLGIAIIIFSVLRYHQLSVGKTGNHQELPMTDLSLIYQGNHQELPMTDLSLIYQDQNHPSQRMYAELRNLGIEDPLYDACKNGNVQKVEELINHEVDINESMQYRITPLCVACKSGRDDIVKILLRASADVNFCKNGVSPLDSAYAGKRYKIMQRLLNKGADVNYSSEGIDCLNRACVDGDIRAVRILLKAKNIMVNKKVKNESTPLLIACFHGHYEIAKLLLDNGAKVNLRGGSNETSPLFVACRFNHKEIVQLLLDKGAKVNSCRPIDGYSPLAIACRENLEDIVNDLLNKNADANLCGKDKTSPLYFASAKNNENILRMLLKGGAKVNLYMEKNILSPLSVAKERGYGSIVRVLQDPGIE
ncbi:uncharacterized protein LOC144618936 isoform X2 [Crassostrea virginica]